MIFPKLYEVERYRDMTTVFGGYNHQISCHDGQFYDMKNMTSKYFPILSPRKNRGIVRKLTNPQALLDKEDLWWIDDKKLYRNGNEVILEGVSFTDDSPKTMAKMGAYIIIMPDRIWCNVADDNDIKCGYMENKVEYDKGDIITYNICDEYGNPIVWHDSKYYETYPAQDGNYMMSVNSSGKYSLKIYAGSTGMWTTVASTYTQISAEGIGIGFEKEDGVKITTDYIKDSLDNIYVNADEDGVHYFAETYIVNKTDDAITIPGIYSGTKVIYNDISLTVERKVPDMDLITECNNRLWGCSKDGHEIYCCKLGDVKNWNCFKGISTDSWAATVGSDGKFTGAITYLGYPMFFKEDSLIKISVSATGGHQTKETRCRGVQEGSDNSLVILNEILYYKSTTGICGYNGSLPYSISEELGEINYYDAVAGGIGDKYYISMRDNKGLYHMFCYDTKNQIWCKEDNTEVLAFCKHKDELYFVDIKDNTMKSIEGTFLYDVPEKAKEDKFDWFVESGTIGYSSPDNKYIGRINLRITLDIGADVEFFLEYDSSGEWEHKFNMSGTGTRTFSVPIIPKRCDHFRYKIRGRGMCKIHSISKSIEGGSDGK